MSSNYSDRLKLELMATGANANTWGTNTNNNLDVIDAFVSGYLSKSVAGSANITLSTANASDTAESSNRTIELTGALTGDIVVFIPAAESKYSFFNNTSGSQTLTIAATGHTANGIAIAQGAKTTVFCDGASNFNVEILSSTDAGALGSGTLADARFPATLPAVSGANLTNLDAADLASGTIPDARFPATLPALNGSALTNLDGDDIATGTVSIDRLPTITTAKGGTGLTSLGSAGQVLSVTAPGAALEFADAGGGAVGNVTSITQLTGSGNISTRADTLFAIAIAVGGGGSGGCGGHGFGQGQGQPGGSTSGLGMTGAAGSQGAAGFPNPGSNGGAGGSGGGMLGGAPGNNGSPGIGGNSGGSGGTNPFSPLGNGGTGDPGSSENGGGGGAGGAFSDITGPFTRGATVSVTVGAGGIGRPGNRGSGQPGTAGMFRYAEYYT